MGRFNKGDDVKKFERALADKFEVSNVIFLPMARVAIYFTLKHLLKPGQEIILSPYTVADVINMVICAKMVPVFVDLEQSSCNINLDKIEPLINDKTGAVMITHLHGIGMPAHQVLEVCRKHNLPLIEDASQAFGGYDEGERLGTIGDIGIYSIGMYKNINSWYGGAIVSENKTLVDEIRADINQCPYQSPVFILKRMLKGLMTDLLTNPIIFKPLTYWIFRYGFLHDIRWINERVEIELDLKLKDKIPENYLVKYTPFQARLALSQLKEIDLNAKNRVDKAILYHEGLKDVPELVLPPLKKDGSYIYPVFPIQYQDRKKLLKWLMLHKRDVAAQHLKNCADLPSFSDFYRDCPVARKTASEVIILPTYPRYPISEVHKNIKVIRAFFNK